jgi:hypothetical protein
MRAHLSISKEGDMNNSSTSGLFTIMCCFGFIGVLFVIGIFLAVVLLSKNKTTATAPSQKLSIPQPLSPADQASLPLPPPSSSPVQPAESLQITEKSTSPEEPSLTSEQDLCDKYLHKAREEWEFSEGINPERDREKLLKIASYLQLAINNARHPIPNVFGRMALVMMFLGETNKAENFSNVALAQEKHNVFGWLAKLSLAMLKLEGHNPWYVTSDYSTGSDMLVSLVTIGIAAASKSSKVNAIRTAAQNLAWAFQETVRLDKDIDVEDWITTGEMLLGLADSLKPYSVNEPALYKAIFTAQWERADLGEYRERVEDLRARAQALYQLASQ